jgi:hypothetical protein
MEPLFEVDFLCHAKDKGEKAILDVIRQHYLPECILALNTVLFFAGHVLTRTWLVQCMELAHRVATNPTLIEAFSDGGRMRDLVTAFAIDSQELLQANEQGKNKGKATKKEKGIEIWQVTWNEDNDATIDLETGD